MNHRAPRILGALLLASTLAASASAAVIAKPAPLSVDAQNLSPAFVSYGGLAAFHMIATNSGTTSNISQLYLTETGGYSVFGVVTSTGTCTTSGQLECSFGSLAPGQSVEITVALTMPSSGTTANVDFEWATTGYVLGGNQSHGDLFSAKYPIALASPDSDQAGSYIWNASQTAVEDGTTLSRGNRQSTGVTVNVLNGPVSVQDGSGLSFTCLTTCPSSFFGEWSELNVNNGQVFGSPFQVVITQYRPGVNANAVNGVYHQWTDGTGAHENLIITTCPTDGSTPTTECFTASKLGSQNLKIVVWLFHNGTIHSW